MQKQSVQLGVALLLTAVVAVGCAEKSNRDTSRDTAVADSKPIEPKPVEPKPAEPRPAEPRPVEPKPVEPPPERQTPRPVPPPRPRVETIVVSSGTVLIAVLETPVSTGTNHDGDAFQARTIDSVVVDGRTAIPAGAVVQGVLRNVQASGKIKDRARMTLEFVRVDDVHGQSHAITAQPLALQAKSETRGDVEKIAAGGVIGAIIGGVAGGKKGAVIGAGAGAGAGTVLVLATKGDEVELAAGHRLIITVLSDTSIPLVARN